MFHIWINRAFLAAYVCMHIICGLCAAQSPSNVVSDCPNSMLSLMNCEPYLSGALATPPDSCCAGLNDLVTGSSTCLCEVISQTSNLSDANLTRALQLPVKCGIPARGCAAVEAPPTGSPSISSPSSQPASLHPSDKSGSPTFKPSSFFKCCCAVLLTSVILHTNYWHPGPDARSHHLVLT